MTLFRPISLLAILLALSAVTVAGSSYAQGASSAESASKHPVVVYTEGPRANEAKQHLLDALPSTADVQKNEDFRRALGKQGQRIPFGLVISLPDKRGAVVKRIGKALASMGAEAAVIGFIRPRRAGGHEVIVLVVEKDGESPSIDQTVTLGAKTTKADVEAALGELIAAWKPPEVTDKPKEDGDDKKDDEKKDDGDDKKDDDEPPGERPVNVYGHEIFNINASFQIGGRFFGYNDGISANLRDYSVFGTPGISARAEVYPLAPLQIIVAKDIGLTGEFRIAPVISSETRDGTVVDTTWMRFGGGLRYRIPIPGPEDNPFVLGVRGSAVREVFEMDADGPLGEEVPSVGYTFIRFGLDGRFPIGPVAITAFGGYLGSVDSGAVHERFRDPSIGGIDVGGGLTVPIALGFEARVQAEYIRWFYAFAPAVGDPYVAGGALDEYVHLEIGPQYVY